jgi:hypothetical protein
MASPSPRTCPELLLRGAMPAMEKAILQLTEEQRQALCERSGGPVEVIDPLTRRIYVLVAAEQYARGRPLPQDESHNEPPLAVPPGIRRSQEALRCALRQLLCDKRLRGKFIAYAGDERIGIAENDADLIRLCLRRGLQDDQYVIGIIEPAATRESPEVEYGFAEYDADLPPKPEPFGL